MFELILLPAAPGFSLLIANAHAVTPEECESQGMVYNAATNSCNISNSAAQGLNNVAKCEGHPNKEECYKQHAMDQMTKDSQNGDVQSAELKKSGLTNVTTGIATVGALAIAVNGLKESKGGQTCKSISYWLMIGGAATLVMSDLIANITHDSKVKNVRRKWGDILNGEKEAKGDKDKLKIAGIEAQSAAFGLLAESEDAMVKTSKTKSLMYKIAGGAFAGSAIAAGLEQIAESNPATGVKAKVYNTCFSKENRKDKARQEAVEELNSKNITSEQYDSRSKDPKFKRDQKVLEELRDDQIKEEKRIQDIINNSPKVDNTKPEGDLVRHQIIYNIENAQDLPALYINHLASLEEYQSPSIEDYETIKETYSELKLDNNQFTLLKSLMLAAASNLNPFPTAHARQETLSSEVYKKYETSQVKASTWTLGGSLATFAGLQWGAKAFKGEWIQSSYARMAFSGVLSGLSFKLAHDANNQAKASEARAEHLRKIEQSMLDSTNAMNICKSEDRNNQSKPHCYCYTSDNAPNPSRANSKICQGLYAGNTEILPGEYNKLPGTSSTCIDNSYAPNPNCTCKKNNSCMKLNMAGLKLLNPGSFKVTGAAFGPVQDIANGTYDPANVSSASLDQNAARLDALQKQIEKHPALQKYAKEKAKMQKGMESSLMNAARSLPSSMASSGMRSLPSNPTEAMQQLEDELKKPSLSESGNSEGGAVAAQSPSESLEFGLSSDDLANQEGQIAEVMNKDFEYGSNDINNGSSTNIFEVLSNRYQRSGMRRLFDEKNLTQPEAPAKSDITQ